MSMINKPQSLALAAFAALFSASAFAGGPEMLLPAPNPFEGFFVGGTVSLNQTGYQFNSQLDFSRQKCVINPSTVVTTTEIASQEGGDTEDRAYGGVRGGYGKTFRGRWYAGVEGFGSFGNSDGETVTTLFPDNPDFTASLTNDGHVGDNWGVNAKLGVLLSPTTLAYSRIGVVWAKIKSTVDVSTEERNASTPITSSSSSKNQSTFLWGFGVEQFVWGDAVSIFGEYTHANFTGVTTSADFPNQADSDDSDAIRSSSDFFTFKNTTKVTISAFTGGINFHFRGPFARWI
jgi:hypothetical protein